jgi:hypothetical protein
MIWVSDARMNFWEGGRTREDFLEGLARHVRSPEKQEKIFWHEMSHYNKAKELGYLARFSIESYVGNPWGGCLPSVEISPPVELRHLREILLAPKEPSPSDLWKAQKIDLPEQVLEAAAC